ncbi:EscS/YscS/HrcS family type III secretion system export apparatus protein [Burkholderia pyrrocinia]|uniref:EscS/YscS/HrcS family type III secretion system export apparatus protein n=1 Tax=Burkholderia pyrrocinia TaxID=60550 RepID=UPI001052D060|nr:flagellar biosynthetic protein FliQ [Burkholderia pyrrocinia]TDA48275.1 flagellar biosynthetic protein FliQ [Burkholderia pyrrocinia]
MDAVSISQVMHRFLVVVILVSGPVVAVALLVGVVVGLLQAITQVQDQSIAYGVKIATVAVLLIVSGRWMGQEMLDLFERAFAQIVDMGTHNRDREP